MVMKKILFVGALIISAMVMAQAPVEGRSEKKVCKVLERQTKPLTPESMAIQKALKYRESLQLTEKQFNKVYKVYLDEFSTMKEDSLFFDKSKKNISKEECESKMAERQKLADKRNKKMKSVLDDAQYALWQELDKPKRAGFRPNFEKAAKK